MNINIFRRQTLGGFAVAALLAGMSAAAVDSLSTPLPADDPPIPKAEDFSPYVTEDGGISLPQITGRSSFTWARLPWPRSRAAGGRDPQRLRTNQRG